MTYFLDFDRTLFDYETFKVHLETLPEWQPFARSRFWRPEKGDSVSPEERKNFWEKVDDWYADGDYSFQPDEFRRFLFSDAEEFLTQHGESSVIVTAGGKNTKYQEDKVASSGATDLVREVCLVPGRSLSKAPSITLLAQAYPPPYIFVDDLPRQLDEVAQALPGITVYEMRRDGGEGCGRYPVIRSLNELST